MNAGGLYNQRKNMSLERYSQKYFQMNRGRSIVFDAREAPFFQVSPELSELGRSPQFENYLRAQYPALQFDQGCVVDGGVLIQDASIYSTEAQGENSFQFNVQLNSGNFFVEQMVLEGNLPPPPTAEQLLQTRQRREDTITNLARRLNLASDITLQVVNGFELTRPLMKRLNSIPEMSDRDSKKWPLLIFPGNGAKTVAEYMLMVEPLWLEVNDSVYLNTNRKMIKDGVFELKIDENGLESLEKFERQLYGNTMERDTVVIVDDVVASGQTMLAIADVVRKRYPHAKIIAASWLFINPTEKVNKASPSGLDGIDRTYAVMALKGNYVSRPPVMSLSCFLRNDGKYDQAKASFMEKYINDPKEFQNMIRRMKEEWDITV